jgi:beta-glucosidase
MKKALITVMAALAALPLAAQPKLTKDNVEDVIKAMSLQDKATLLVGGARMVMVNGIPTGEANRVPGAAGATRTLEKYGIPQTVLSDGPAGIRINPTRPGDKNTYYATGFPTGTVLAATWDLDLVEKVTEAMGNEFLEYGADVALAPGMNIHRNPLCGRNFEYFSEDPVLSGNMAAAYVKGIQSNGVGVSIKHFAGNDAETNRNEADSRISVRALREIYLKNFEIAVRKSDPWTVMSSYNKLNGEYTQQSKGLLTDVLRGDWGYKGIVMTDWGSKAGTVNAVKAQNDLMEPGNTTEIDRIVKGVESGAISMEEVDRNVRNMLNYIVKTPVFNGYKYSNKPDLKAHAELVRQAGAEGLILLKNEGALPLAKNANVALFGNASYDLIAGGTGSGDVHKAHVISLDKGLSDDGFGVDKTTSDWYAHYLAFQSESQTNNSSVNGGNFFWGRTLAPELNISDNFVARTAPKNDVAIVTICRNAGEGADRHASDGDFYLNETERANLKAIADGFHAAGKKVVVVLNIGGVIETASWMHMADAIVLAYQPGQEGGYSIADVLSGKVNPSGKTPDSFPVSYFDNPSSKNFPYNYTNTNTRSWGVRTPVANVDYVNYQEGIYVGYRYFSTFAPQKVTFPFGFGLSYTTFAYSAPKVSATADGFKAQVTVKNTGSVAGKEVVELYVTAPAGKLDKPAVELKSFAKTKLLAPGESQTLTMEVSNYDLASYDEAQSAFVTDEGTYVFKFCASSQDVRASAEAKVKKAGFWKTSDVLHPSSELKLFTVDELSKM